MEKTQEIELKTTIQTDTLPQSFSQWESPAKNLKNTGIERDGGITNLYKNTRISENTYFTKSGHSVKLTKNDELGLRDYAVEVDGLAIGELPAWSVTGRKTIPLNVHDACMAWNGNLLVCTLEVIGGASQIVVRELDPNTFEELNMVYYTGNSVYERIYFIRNRRMSYTSANEFVCISNQSAYILTNSYTPKLITLPTGMTANPYSVSAFHPSNSSAYIIFFQSEYVNNGNCFLIETGGTVANTLVLKGNLIIDSLMGDETADSNAFYVYNNPALHVDNKDLVCTKLTHYFGSWTKTEFLSGSTTPIDAAATFGNCIYQKAGTVYEAYGKRLMGGATTLRTITGNAITDASAFQEVNGDIMSHPARRIGIQCHTINRKNAYYSFRMDGYEFIGAPITEIGEIDGTYLPSFDMDYLVNKYTFGMIYKNASGKFIYLSFQNWAYIDANVNIFSEISDRYLQINVNSAMNVIDLEIKAFCAGLNAYNGLAIHRPLTTGTIGNLQLNTIIQTPAGSGVDLGTKIINTTTKTTQIQMPDQYGVLYTTTIKADFAVDNYNNLNYQNSLIIGNGGVVKLFDRSPIYVPDNRIPYPAGSKVNDSIIELTEAIALREADYAGYQIGNTVNKVYDSFMLFGQVYFFDGLKIYGVSVSSANIILQIVPLVDASGMTLVCQSPTAVFFLSDFDNSLYTFDGGRTLSKQIRMSQKSKILMGVFGVEENTLALLLDDNSVIFMRDGLMTQVFNLGSVNVYGKLYTNTPCGHLYNNTKGMLYTNSARPSSISLLSNINRELKATINGIYYLSKSGYIRYSYNSNVLSNELQTVEPLTLQTAYYGTDRNDLQSTTRWVLRLYNAEKSLTNVKLKWYAFTQDKILNESKTFLIGDSVNPWDTAGYAYISFLPSSPRNIANSLKIESNHKITVTDLYAYTDVTDRNVTKNKG